MFGFVIGTLSLIGLVKVVRHGRYGHWGPRHWRHGHFGRGFGPGAGPRRWVMRRLFERLDTTVGQEKVIEQAAEEVERAGYAAREAFFRARAEYARLMRADQFDAEAVKAAFDKQQAALDEVKKVLSEGMQKIHEVLNPQQRAQVGDLLEYGPRAFAHGGCRGGHHHHRGHRPFEPAAGAVNL